MTDVDAWGAYERVSRDDASELTLADRRLLALGGLRTEVNNGGFHQYFFNWASDLVTDALTAAEAVGANELASLIQRDMSLLNAPEPADRVARQSALGDIEPDEFADLDDDYYALEASFDLDAVMRAIMRSGGGREVVARRPTVRYCRVAGYRGLGVLAEFKFKPLKRLSGDAGDDLEILVEVQNG